MNSAHGRSGDQRRSDPTMEQIVEFHLLSQSLSEERNMAARHRRRNHGGGIPFPRSPAATRASR
jgi:hypothetical protein